MAQFVVIAERVGILCSPGHELPVSIAVALGTTSSTPKEVFLLHLGTQHPEGAGPPLSESQAREATRKILRAVMCALQGSSDTGPPAPTKAWVLVRASREARYPAWIPKQNISPEKPGPKKMVVHLAVNHPLGEEPVDGEDLLWYLCDGSVAGVSL